MRARPLHRHLVLGGVVFRVTSDFPVGALHRDPLYQAFEGPPPGPRGEPGVEVRLRGRAPEAPAADAVACRTPSWQFAREGDTRVLARDPGGSRAAWVARFRLPLRTVDVDCLPPDPASPSPFWSPFRYPLDQLLLLYALAGAGGLLVHAAGAVLDGRGAAFPGRSGAGKTTLCRLLADTPGVAMLSDDRVILRRRGDRWCMHGTPWAGEAGIASPGPVALGGLAFLVKGEAPRAEPLDPVRAAEHLLPVTSVPWFDNDAATAACGVLDRLAREVPACRLHGRADATTPAYLLARWPA